MSSGFYLTSGVLYLNLGCEVMYVLFNRMQAQKVDMEKGNRILSDIVKKMFMTSFVENILKPQTPISIPTFYDLFSKLVNSSIMKLDKPSTEKLFYLVLMTFKKQVFLCSSPLELHALTIAHLQELIKIVPSCQGLIERSIDSFVEMFRPYGIVIYVEIREEILSMLESYHSRIILFVETGYQRENGLLIHRPRNYHNRKVVSFTVNHPSIDLDLPANIPTNKLEYEDFRKWETDLAKDYYADKRGSSKQIKQSKPPPPEQSTSMSDFLGLKIADLNSYEVQLDIFSKGAATSSVQSFQPLLPQGPQLPEQKVETAENKLVSKIEKQFIQLQNKEEQNQELDLLDMMDN